MIGVCRMTLKTSGVRVCADRNRECRVARRFVTSRAIRILQMLCVIETGIKTLQRREIFHDSGFRIRMTNRADRAFIIGKLLRMTTDARRVSAFTGQADARRIVVAAMANQTRKLRMILIGVRKFRQSWRVLQRIR